MPYRRRIDSEALQHEERVELVPRHRARIGIRSGRDQPVRVGHGWDESLATGLVAAGSDSPADPVVRHQQRSPQLVQPPRGERLEEWPVAVEDLHVRADRSECVDH